MASSSRICKKKLKGKFSVQHLEAKTQTQTDTVSRPISLSANQPNLKSAFSGPLFIRFTSSCLLDAKVHDVIKYLRK